MPFWSQPIKPTVETQDIASGSAGRNIAPVVETQDIASGPAVQIIASIARDVRSYVSTEMDISLLATGLVYVRY